MTGIGVAPRALAGCVAALQFPQPHPAGPALEKGIGSMATAKQLGTDDPETLQKIIRHCDADCERLRAANPTPFDIATACLYWTKYPLLVAIIGDDRRTSERYEAYNFLSRAHRHAAKLLCAVADRKGIDGGAIYSAGEICRELFRWAPNTHRDGHFPYAWPDCLGLSRKALPEHDQQIIRAGSAAYTRLVAHLRIQLPPERPTHQLDKSLSAILDDVDARIMAIAGSQKPAEDRMQEIVELDYRAAGWKSKRWGELLGVTDAAIRGLDFWKKIRRKGGK